MQNEYDVFAIRDYYPSENDPSSSVFVHQQVMGLKKEGIRTLVISPQPYIPPIIKKKIQQSNSYQYLYTYPHINIKQYQGIDIIRPTFIKIPSQYLYRISHYSINRTIEKYANKYTAKLIHAHFGQNGAASLRLKERTNLPLITSFYGYDSGRLAIKFKNIYKN